MQAAESMQIVQITPPDANTSYSLHFFGPALQCEQANETQVPIFEYYSSALASGGELIMTQSTFQQNNTLRTNETDNDYSIYPYPLMLYFSAFAPMLPYHNYSIQGSPVGIIYNPISKAGGFDEFNDWIADLPQDVDTNYPTFGGLWPSVTPLQLWVQTANESFVCTLMNTSYETNFEYNAGTQNVLVENISYLEPMYVGSDPQSLGLDQLDQFAYLAVFIATTNMLSGNVTTTVSDADASSIFMQDNINKMTLHDSSSRVLLTGLTACDEFTTNFWTHNPISGFYNNSNHTMFPVPLNNSNPWEQYGRDQSTLPSYTNDLFTQPAWMCRNRTLMHAIEDLSQNITISMLSSAELT
jgi:hypothetical protein